MKHKTMMVAFAMILTACEAQAEKQKVTVYGNILGDSRADAVKTWPGSRSIVDKQQLEQGANRTLDDALQRIPGVKIQDETGTGILPQISVRGLYDSRSGRAQVLEDSIPLALAPYGQEGLSLFPITFAMIDRIDIVRGGAAVQYGPNNVGGVINLISKPIPIKWRNEISERATFYGKGRNLWDTYLKSGGMVNDDFGLQVEVNKVKGSSFREHSDNDVTNLRLRSIWNINEASTLKFSYQYYDAFADLAGALSTADYRNNRRQSTRPYDKYSGKTNRYTLDYNQQLGSLGFIDAAEFNWWFFNQHSDRDFHVGMSKVAGQNFNPALTADILQNSPRNFNVWGTEPRFSFDIDGEHVNQHWIVGGRFVSEKIDYQVRQLTFATDTTTITRNWDFTDQAWAGYVSNAIKLVNDQLTITPGVRYEHLSEKYLDKKSGVATTSPDTQWLPGLTVGYQLTPAWFLFGDMQKSQRPAQVTQIVKGGDVSSELAWNYETGLRYTPDQALSLQANLYRIDYNDQISYNSVSDNYLNIGKTRHQGIELEGFWTPERFSNLKLHVGYAFLQAKQRNGVNRDKAVPYASRNQITLDGSYNWHETTLSLAGYYFSKSYSDAANTVKENASGSLGQMPAYWVWNVQASRDIYKSATTKLTGYLSVNNLFNRDYWFRGIDTSPWGRQPAPGRSLTAGLSLKF